MSNWGWVISWILDPNDDKSIKIIFFKYQMIYNQNFRINVHISQIHLIFNTSMTY